MSTAYSYNILSELNDWKLIYTQLESEATNERHKVRFGNIIRMMSEFDAFSSEFITDIQNAQSLPHGWLQRRGDQTLLEYWEPILRAAQQYQVKPYKSLLDKGYDFLDELIKTDQKKLLGDSNPIILYLEKTGKYKRYPFGNIYLVGIPLLDAHSDDWMAIPHELGHHIYWNSGFSGAYKKGEKSRPVTWSRLLDEEISTILQELTGDIVEKRTIRDLLEAWSEEIFVDIIGAKIAGRLFVDAAFKKINRDVEKIEDVYKSDKDHPIPYFQPYIRAYAINESLNDDDERWNRFISPRPIETVKYLREILKNFVIKISHIIDQRLETSKLTNWREGNSGLGQLNAMIKKSHPRVVTDDERIRLLLTPKIHEEGDSWTCVNGHVNNSSVWSCETCGAWRIFSFLSGFLG